MKRIKIEDTFLEINGVNFDLEVKFRHHTDFTTFVEMILTAQQYFDYYGNKRTFTVSGARLKKALTILEDDDI